MEERGQEGKKGGKGEEKGRTHGVHTAVLVSGESTVVDLDVTVLRKRYILRAKMKIELLIPRCSKFPGL